MNLVIYSGMLMILLVMITAADAAGTVRKKIPALTCQDGGTDSIAWRGKTGKISLKSFGKCIIYEKDGSQVRTLVLREIHDHWVVYEKNGSLHDKMIEKIDRIQLGSEGVYFLYFTEKHKPYVVTR